MKTSKIVKQDIKYPAQMKSRYRTVIDQYYSVQFSIIGLINIYQFKLRDLFSKGMCIAVKEDSAIIKYIKAGDMLNMKYCTTKSGPTENIKTKIKSINKIDQKRFKGHSLLWLSILDDAGFQDF